MRPLPPPPTSSGSFAPFPVYSAPWRMPFALTIGLVLCGVFLAGCGRRRAVALETAPPPPPQKVSVNTTLYTPMPLGTPSASDRPPWIGHVHSVDLDGDGLLDVLACESQENEVIWFRQIVGGRFTEQVIGRDLRAPVRAETGDLDRDGDLDVIVSSMGVVFPNNDRIGSLFVLENLGNGQFRRRTLLENVARVVDARAADLNGDGRIDLAVAQFGYDQGQVQWLAQTGPWEFQSQVLLELSGAMNICVGDFAGDSAPDLAVQFSQQWEEIEVFENIGQNCFRHKRVWASSNEDYGSSGMTAADLNRDGRLDLVFTNGDGFGPAVVPGPRAYHGVQWLENQGNGHFAFHRIGDASGAYSPVVGDFDGDGLNDVAVVAAFLEKDGQNRPVPSLVWFRQTEKDVFEKQILAYSPRHQVTLAAGDFDRSGRLALVTGGFYIFNPATEVGRVTLWRR